MKNKNIINRIAKDALLLSLLIVCAWFSIPFVSSPITLQVFGVILIILLAPGVDSILIILTYIIMGTCGLPVFNGGTSGFGSITYGFIVGFFVASIIIYLYVLIFERRVFKHSFSRKENIIDVIIKCVIFEIIIYIFGLLWYTILSDKNTFFGWLVVFLPYLGIDAIKCTIAIIIYMRLKPILEHQKILNSTNDEIYENSTK